MTRHLLKLVWKRKRANALLIVEIFFSFLVLFAVLTFAAAMLMRYRRPLGFDYSNVWTVRITLPPGADLGESGSGVFRDLIERMRREAASLPEVEKAAASMAPPFAQSEWISAMRVQGRRVELTIDVATDEFADAMKLQLLRGRWFSAADVAATDDPVVVDTDVATRVFGTIDVVGKRLEWGRGETSRIIGVIPPYRKMGEFSKDEVRMVFRRALATGPRQPLASTLVLRLKPGTKADFEETLNRKLHAIAPENELRIDHMDQSRRFTNRIMLAPAIAGGIIALFLIGMVGLGLSGVLWQNVTRRSREIGLRRALGATGPSVNRQILAEVSLLVTLATVVGVFVVAQLPMLGMFSLVTPTAYASGIAGALLAIYAIALTCAFYPGWLASRVTPAHALRYE